MTLEQLSIFLTVAEEGHITRAAERLGLTPSAVSASIKALERMHAVTLIVRVGRGIALTQAGETFVPEARATLGRAQAAMSALDDLAGLKRGALRIAASQTTASHWLPPRLMRFHQRYPDISIDLRVGNTASVSEDVRDGIAEIGLIEGEIDEPALSSRAVARDEMAIVCHARHILTETPPRNLSQALQQAEWLFREQGSGTRRVIETALVAAGLNIERVRIALTFPSNEAVIAALIDSHCVAGLSRAAIQPFLDLGILAMLPLPLAQRDFVLLTHKERGTSAAGRELIRFCMDP